MKNKLLLFGYVFAASFGAFVVGLNLGGISGALEFITAEFGLSAMAHGTRDKRHYDWLPDRSIAGRALQR